MWALDTNVLVRYITQDDKRQSAAAARFIEEELSAARPGFVSLVTLLETVWVLESRYGVERLNLCDLLDDLLSTASLEVQEAPAVRQAVALYRKDKVDLHDALITTLAAARSAQVVTFDTKAARRLEMRLLT
jgi:predicted nucleic-acid-binding protein